MNTESLRRALRKGGLTRQPICPGCRTETPSEKMTRCPACARLTCPECWDAYGGSCIDCMRPEDRGEFTRDGLPNTPDREIEL